ncbi:hypothetical protein P9112_011080 [Eukaryota sp. TZLM1-RC]
MSDTLSDTDWTAKSTERDLDKPTSSTTNRSHSPHLSLHAGKSLEKNLNENFSKPRRKCSKCRKSGHNIATCPLIQKEKLNARAATADLNFSLTHNPENEFLSEIPDNTPIKEDQKDEKNVFFVESLLLSMILVDLYFFVILVLLLISYLSPLVSIPFAVVLRAFTENLRKGLWDVTPIWKFFLKKDKKLLSKKSNFKKNVFSKEKLVRKLALKGRFGSAKQCLFSSDLAECNESTLFQLNHLHPVALNKPGGGVRPIAVGESITRLLAIISFKRVKSSAINFFRPYQFAIGIPDGTTCAALCTDLLFNQKGENYLLNIDFKNAFNSVFRSSILQELELHYPPLLPYFKLMYGSPSNLIFHSENIVSSRGVKQGDPLGPFFFCLALQSVLVKFKSDFPDIHICAYADDLSLIGPLSLLQHGLQHFVFLAKQIGLDIKLPKCFIIGNQHAEVAFNETFIKYVDYEEDAIRFLGSYFGNSEKVKSILSGILEKIEEQLLAIEDLEIDKHLAFSVLNVCFGSKINHLLRSLSPTISHDFARQFNTLRTNFLGNLVEVCPSKIPYHAFFSPKFGGVGFSKAEYLCKSAFIGGMKNFLFEWKLRFDHIPLNESHPLLISLEKMVQELPVDIWNRSFPSSLPAVPSRSFTNLHLAVVKLQKSVLIGFEDLDFSKRLSVTKINNPVFAAFLADIQNCTSLISQQPRPFGLHLTNEAWKQNMRLRLGMYPSGLLDNSYCICNKKPTANFRHIVSCKKFLQYRSVLHNAVRDVTYEMFKCYNFSCKVEPLLKHYSDDNLFNSRRGDLIAPFVDSSQVVVDFTTVDPFALVYRDDVLLSSNGHLNKAEDRKRDKYTEILNDLNKNLYSKFSFVPFAFSIFGNIGQSAMNFINDFGNLCRSSGKNFAENLWKNRIIFALYRSVPKYLSLMMSKLYKDSSRVGVENLVSYVF